VTRSTSLKEPEDQSADYQIDIRICLTELTMTKLATRTGLVALTAATVLFSATDTRAAGGGYIFDDHPPNCTAQGGATVDGKGTNKPIRHFAPDGFPCDYR
jgi:hypothetical protein